MRIATGLSRAGGVLTILETITTMLYGFVIGGALDGPEGAFVGMTIGAFCYVPHYLINVFLMFLVRWVIEGFTGKKYSIKEEKNYGNNYTDSDAGEHGGQYDGFGKGAPEWRF